MGKDTAPELRIEHISTDHLCPDPANPRRITDAELEALTRSIQQFGLVDPIIARHDDKIVMPPGVGGSNFTTLLSRRAARQRHACGREKWQGGV